MMNTTEWKKIGFSLISLFPCQFFVFKRSVQTPSGIHETTKAKIKSFYVMKNISARYDGASPPGLCELKYSFRVIYLIVFSCF